MLALRELQDGMGQLLAHCETHVRSNGADFRANLASHTGSVLRAKFNTVCVKGVQYQKYCRQAEEKLQRLVGAI